MQINNLFFIFIIASQFSILYGTTNKELIFCPIKGDNFGLSKELLMQVKDTFGSNVFIETGTFLGNTTGLASTIFNQVYSVELGTDLYDSALKRFKAENRSNIHLFNESSPDFLNRVIREISQPMAIFLDAHWSEGITVKGDANTPILEELDIIKQTRKTDCVILVDDIRCFRNNMDGMEPSHYDYPTIDILIAKGKEIFGNLGFVIFGDIAILYDANIHDIKVSNVLSAITNYKLMNTKNLSNQENASKMFTEIGIAKGSELDGIIWLMNLSKSKSTYLYEEFLIWRACTLLSSGNINKAKEVLEPIIENCSENNRSSLDFVLKNQQK